MSEIIFYLLVYSRFLLFCILTVAVALLRFGTIEYDGDFAQAFFSCNTVDIAYVFFLGVVGTTYIHGGIGDTGKAECIGNHAYRCRVYDDVIIDFSQLTEQFVYTVA